MNANEEKIDVLIEKAKESEKSEDAMRYSQAALNCAHVLQVLKQTKQ